ncbi:MAG: M28 family peptidase [Flavobacteriales bacterium]
MKKLIYLLLTAAVLGSSAFVCNTRHVQQTGSAFSTTGDLTMLASDAMEGRGVGTEAERRAGAYIAQRFQSIGLQPKGDTSWFQPFTFVPHGALQVHHVGDSAALGMALVKEINGRNVIGFLDNGAANTIIIGAHYDHLGWGDENSLWTGERAIHNGADDNASGTSALIQLAAWLTQKPKGTASNNYLFIAFSGEEKGLWGSNHFCKNPTVDLKKVNYMLNMDMVGRLNAEKKLAINGVGTSTHWMKILPDIKADGIQIVTSESGVGPSDHTSFYLMDIPVLHFFTGQHADYHKPTDDTDKINFAGIESVMKYMRELILRTDAKGKIDFQKTKDDTQQKSSFKVTLGVMPDYMHSGPGMRIDGVSEGKTAHTAGIIKGDIVTRIGDHEVNGMEDYMNALNQFEKGQSAKVTVLRNGEEMVFDVVWK